MQAAPPSAHAAPHPAAHRTVDVAIETADGTFVVRLDAERAPLTTANFLRYVDSHAYDGATFYRVVTRATKPDAPFEVIQGGNEKRGGANGTPIPLEPTSKTGLHNDDGTIAMARTADPNSATSEFFIDVGEARYLDDGGALAPGYAAFGRVVRGMAVVRKIFGSPVEGDQLTPPIAIERMSRLPAR